MAPRTSWLAHHANAVRAGAITLLLLAFIALVRVAWPFVFLPPLLVLIALPLVTCRGVLRERRERRS